MSGKTVSDSDTFNTLTFVAIARNGDVIIPRGETVIQAEDKVMSPADQKASRRVQKPLTRLKRRRGRKRSLSSEEAISAIIRRNCSKNGDTSLV